MMMMSLMVGSTIIKLSNRWELINFLEQTVIFRKFYSENKDERLKFGNDVVLDSFSVIVKSWEKVIRGEQNRERIY